jgi:uncharacterized membrane protein YfcA
MFYAEPTVMVVAGAAVFAAALASSIAGFAFSALVGAALLYLYRDPVPTIAMVFCCSIAAQAYGVWALRREIEWRSLVPYLAGGLLTVPLGVFLLKLIPGSVFALCLGVVAMSYALWQMLGRELRLPENTRRADGAVGALGGLVGGLTGSPSLIMCMWCNLRGWPKERQRALYQPYILAMQILAIACLGATAPSRIPLESLFLMPVALVAAHLGFAIFRRLTTPQFNFVFQGLLIVAGVSLLAQAI